ncbi:MAG TPA: lysophospholipid acyltransferase family protein [Candidatus Dormibacteraeota bacterium]|nr:lysophospholipid acyltransferase family protein [Candidatus Dormibacteraeota bacterium]
MRATLRFRAARSILRRLLLSVFRVRVEGLERLPSEPPYVLACNHLGWLDPFLLIACLPASPRVHFLGKRSAIENRAFKRWILRFIGGVIPVESGKLEHLSAAVAEVLHEGGVVAIFPEGGVGPTEGQLQRLRGGVAHFSEQNRAPVVAAGLAGTSELWRGKEIRLRIGTTVEPASPGLMLAAVERALVAAIPPPATSAAGSRLWPWLTHLLR